MVAVPGAWLPGRLLFGDRCRHLVGVRQLLDIQRLVDGTDPCLVTEQLADGHLLFAAFGELRPVGCHALIIVEEPS
jgi:hypothetical protein